MAMDVRHPLGKGFGDRFLTTGPRKRIRSFVMFQEKRAMEGDKHAILHACVLAPAGQIPGKPFQYFPW